MIPKRGIAVVIAGIGAALLLAGASPKISQVKPIVLTYWEAKAAGFHVPPLPSETGMRVCTEDDLDNPGYRSPEAAEKALAEYEARWGESGGPGDCQVDPKTMQYVVFPPGHGPGSMFSEDG